MRQDIKQYINGEWVESHSGQTLDVINPATEEVMGKIAAGNKQDVDDAVAAAKKVYVKFRNTSLEERKALLERIADEYENRKKDLIDVMTDELGSPIEKSESVHFQMGLNHFREASKAIDSGHFLPRSSDNGAHKSGPEANPKT